MPESRNLRGLYSEQQSSVKDQLDSLQEEVRKVSTESENQMVDLRKRIEQAVHQLQGNGRNTTTTTSAGVCTQGHLDLTDVRHAVSKLNIMTQTIPRDVSILRHLDFTTLHQREDSVEKPKGQTYAWMVEEQQMFPGQDTIEFAERQHVSHSFLSHMRSSNGVFFICGKPGCGKSTLMKFLSYHSRVLGELDAWASGKTLILIRVFFWNSGDKLQMSQEGFLRSVLFEVLAKCPDLIRQTFRNQWENAPEWHSNKTFRLDELTSAFKCLERAFQSPDRRFCFFIDGLDEYEGDSIQHSELASCLQSWGQSDSVKIVCAGRSHSEFLDTFSAAGRTIHLHRHTRSDIRRYARTMFLEILENAEELNVTQEEALSLVDGIVDVADGVFLWARLVVRSLVGRITKYASIKALREALEDTPKDLNEVFRRMLKSVDKSARKRSDDFLLLAVHNPASPLNALIYSWIENLDDPKFPFELPYHGYSDDEVQRRHRIVRHQLDDLTKGLLEMRIRGDSNIPPYFQYRVEFFHRSVKDYLKDEWRRGEILSHDSCIPTAETYCRLYLAEAKFLRPFSIVYLRKNFFAELCDISHDEETWFRHVYQSLPVSYIDEFNRIFYNWRCLCNSHRSTLRGCPGAENCDEATCPLLAVQGTSNIQLPGYWLNLSKVVNCDLSENRVGAVTFNILLIASQIPDPELVRYLLSKGMSPNDQVEVVFRTSLPNYEPNHELRMDTIPIWMAFLYIFALEIGKSQRKDVFFRHFYRIDRYAAVAEHLLAAGADADVVFLASRGHGLRVWNGRAPKIILSTEDSQVDDPRPTADVFYIELHQLLRFCQQDGNLGSNWKRTSPRLRQRWKLLPWIVWGMSSQDPIRDKYRPVEMDELRQEPFYIFKVVSKTYEVGHFLFNEF